MKITWIGHSCFKVEKNGYTIVIDPYKDGSVPGLFPVNESADQVICTHEHDDHSGRENVVLTENQECPFTIREIQSFHDQAGGSKRGLSNIIILDDGENRIAHLGDLGCSLSEEQKEQLNNLDALLIPVGGFYTIDARQAAEIAGELNPKIIIPMHFRDDESGYGYDVIGTCRAFTVLMDSVCFMEESTLESTEEQRAKVVVLRPQNSRR